MDIHVGKLIKILLTGNKYWRDESIRKICSILSSDQRAFGPILNEIRRVVIESEASSWDARIAAGECIRQMCALMPMNDIDDSPGSSTVVVNNQEGRPLIKFDLANVIQSLPVLGAGESGADSASGFPAGASHRSPQIASARSQLNRHLEMNPVCGVGSEHFVSDAELLDKSQERLQNGAPPAKLIKLEADDDVIKSRDQAEKSLVDPAATPIQCGRAFERLLVDDLRDAAWSIRHGAAVALKGLRVSFAAATLDALLACLARDFFNDFVDGHAVVAPVRETCAQVVALMLAKCQDSGDEETILEALFAIRSFLKPPLDQELNKFRWKYIHSGLLLAKYALPIVCKRLTSDRLRPAIGDLLENVCLCIQHQNEDLIQVCCDSLECCLSNLRGWYPDLNDRLIDIIWKRLLAGCYDPQLDEWAVALLRTASKLTFNPSSTSACSLDPRKLAILCSFMKRTISSQAFQAACQILLHSAQRLGTKEWSEDGILHVMRCLFVRRLVADPANVAENDLNISLWTLILGQTPPDPVLKPLAPFFNQWLCAPFVPDNHPAINLALVSPDPVESGAPGQTAFLGDLVGSGGACSSVENPQQADSVAMAKMGAAEFLAHFAHALYVNKISAWWTSDNAENWLQELLLNHLCTDSANQKSFLYMVLLNWLKIAEAPPTFGEARFPLDALRPRLSIDRIAAERRMSAEILPLLTELNKMKQTLKNQLIADQTSIVDKDRLSIFCQLLDQTVIDFDQAERFVDRLTDLAPSTLFPPDHLRSGGGESPSDQMQLFERIVVDLVRKMRQLECRPAAWLACCQMADRTRPLPQKINALVSALTRIVKQDDASNSDTLSVETVKALHLLLSRLIAEKRTNVAEKLIKNLVYLNSSAHLDLFKNLCNQNVDEKEIIVDWQSRVASFARQNLSATSVFQSLDNRLPSNLAGSVLRLICSECQENLAAVYPTLFDLLNRAFEPSDSVQQSIIGLGLFNCLLPDLHRTLRERIIDRGEDRLLAHLSSQSATVRHVTGLLIGSLARHSPDFFTNRILVRLVDQMTSEAPGVAAKLGCVEIIMNILDSGCAPPPAFFQLVTLPLLARMNDRNECLRCVSATCLSAVIKLLPLHQAATFDPCCSSSNPTLSDLVQKRLGEVGELMALLSRPGSIVNRIQPNLSHQPSCGLRAYQKEGVAWLMFLHRYHLNGLLGDDMGLGKTVQTLCCVANGYSVAKQKDVARSPCLVVCPKTLVGHWLNETAKFFDPSSIRAYNLDTLQQKAEFEQRPLDADAEFCPLFVTSYEFLRRQVDFFARITWFYCVLDEGHVIRNEKTATSQAVLQLKSRHRIVLSGTPVQNNVLELWTLFEFLLPGYLGDKKRFNRLYGKTTTASAREIAAAEDKSIGGGGDDASVRALDALHKLVLPFILRRRKGDVLADLPPKIVQDVVCDLTPLQSTLYRDFVDQWAKRRRRRRDDKNKSRDQGGSALQVLAYLRKLCDHPCLVLDDGSSNPEILNEIRRKYEVDSADDYKLSAKMIALKQLLAECGIGDDAVSSDEPVPTLSESHRALIFCQFTSVIGLISRYFDSNAFGGQIKYLTMDGSTNVDQRQKIVDRFNSDADVDVLLLTTAVGGLGLNLIGADVVIFVDHEWNPCKDLQAMDRAHRLGQRRTVNVYRLICKDSLEEKMMRYQKFKSDASNTVISDQNASLHSMGTDQLLDLLQDSVSTGYCSSGKLSAKASTQSSDNLAELWDQSQYEDAFNLKSFLKQANH